MKISQWRLGKNVKDREMKAILRKQAKFKAKGNEVKFQVRGYAVEAEKIERYKKRKNVSEIANLLPPSPAAGERIAL
jgi:hypothetical protein